MLMRWNWLRALRAYRSASGARVRSRSRLQPLAAEVLEERLVLAAYNVFALPAVSPIDGTRSIAVDPHDTTASPYGWHDTDGVAGAEFTDTRGNNVLAQEDVNADDAGGFRPSGGASLNFDFAYDPAQDPATSQDAALTNVFYLVNLLHDIHYQYGFTEEFGNFQTNNYGRGGVGNDPVIVDIQDGDGGSDGFFTLPDGQSPRMTLYRRDNPFRDRAFDSHIIIHEYGHGVSGRLTGGPGNTTALNAIQSKAMGEGWGDWWALMLTQVTSDAKLDAYGIGNYAAGFAADGPGIRTYPYSFDMTINPLTYDNFNGGAVNNQEHKAGAIWASALWDMNWQLIDKHGFSPDMMHGTGGNNLALQLVMDGLKLQGTNPSFLAGRDAILAADLARTGGANQTEIWTAFARRGMGFSASDGGSASSTTVVAAFDVPASISGTVFRDDDASGTQNAAEPGLAGWTVYLDQNNNGIADVASVATYNSVDTPKTITDRGITYSNRTVSGLVGTIVDINVTVTLTHPYDGELYLTLISPTNTPVILANYLGGSGDNYTNTTFDDEATTYISAGAAPFTGSFKPYFDLAQLDGRDPNGTWKLRMDDAVLGNVGQLLSWSMQITYGNEDITTVTDANGNYAFHGLGDGTHHVREIPQAGFIPTTPANGLHDVIISGGQPISDRDFGNQEEVEIVIPSLSINDVSIIEGDSGLSYVTFTALLSAASEQDVTLNYATSNGSATAPNDFTAVSGQLTIPAGMISQTISVPIVGDLSPETSESFFLNLSNAINASIVDGQGLATITDNDVVPSLSIGDVSVVEGSSGQTFAIFTVSLSNPSGKVVTVNYSTTNSTAVVPADYASNYGTLSFPVGTTTRPISVAIRPDLMDELDETFFVNLLNATNATIADNRAIGTITDDDMPPTMSIKDVVVFEANSGQALANFTVSLSAASGHAISVNYATADGTAVAGVDYAAISGTLILAAGTLSKTFTVPFYGDILDEANETFFVNLSNAINTSLIDSQALATITDNDAAPSLMINDVAVIEGNSGTTNATFTVTLSAISGQAVSVNFVTTNGTALANSDYSMQSGTLIFAPGEKTRTINIATLGDTLDEINETYFVKLSAATNATITDSSGAGTITDNDAAPTLSINNVTVVESHAGLTTATFTVTLSAASGQTVSVNFTTANNSAVAGSDYTATYGTLTFAPGVLSKTITVSIRGDIVKELDEFFFVNLTNPLNATIADSQGLGKITNDD